MSVYGSGHPDHRPGCPAYPQPVRRGFFREADNLFILPGRPRLRPSIPPARSQICWPASYEDAVAACHRISVRSSAGLGLARGQSVDQCAGPKLRLGYPILSANRASSPLGFVTQSQHTCFKRDRARGSAPHERRTRPRTTGLRRSGSTHRHHEPRAGRKTTVRKCWNRKNGSCRSREFGGQGVFCALRRWYCFDRVGLPSSRA